VRRNFGAGRTAAEPGVAARSPLAVVPGAVDRKRAVVVVAAGEVGVLRLVLHLLLLRPSIC
jgi:hypothetical protein